MKTPIRVAIAGCGNIARRAHVPAWLDRAQTEIVALCDPSAQAMKQITERHGLGCSLHHDLGELLEEVKPDVVDVCSPTPFHYPLAKRALEAGCHVLLEKPPAQTLAEAEELNEIARANGLKLGVSFNYRYRDLVQNLKRVQEQGLLGEVVKVHITHHGPLIFADAEWTWDERRSRYLLWESGIHFLDILVHLFGPHEEIVSVIPTVHPGIKHTTDIEVTVRFKNGGTGRLEIVADSTRHSSFFTQMNVYGTAADAFVRWFPNSMMIVSGQVNPFALLLNEAKAIWELGTKVLTGQYLKQRNVSHYRLIGDYVEWLAGRADFGLKMEDALPTLRLLAEISEHIPAYRAAQEIADPIAVG
jgi:UDP-N-acetyl-2-amino-2-deoxyglucuronate dehydrogenase